MTEVQDEQPVVEDAQGEQLEVEDAQGEQPVAEDAQEEQPVVEDVQEEQPVVEDVQGEVPPAVSEETEPNEVLDSDMLPENLDSLTDASLLGEDTTPPAFADGYPKQWEPADYQTPLYPGCKRVKMIVQSLSEVIKAYYVAVKHDAPAPSSAQVKAGKDSEDKEALDFDDMEMKYSGVILSYKLPADDTIYDFWVVLEDATGILSEPKKVELKTSIKLWPDGYPQVGEDQPDGSKQVKILAKANGYQSATAYYVAVTDGSPIPHFGYIKNGNDHTGNPALAAGSVEVPADTQVSAIVTLGEDNTDYDIYVALFKQYHGGDFITGCESDIIRLDVKTPVAAPLSIFEVRNEGELTSALASVPIGGTIKLMNDFTSKSQIRLISKDFTFDLNGYTLNILTDINIKGGALDATNSTVKLTGEGEFNVTGHEYGVKAHNSFVTVTNATANKLFTGIGAYAGDWNCGITVRGNVIGYAQGVFATGSNTEVTVMGNATALDTASGWAAVAHNGAKVKIHGDATGLAGGVKATTSNSSRSSIFVLKDVNAKGVNGCGVYVMSTTEATIDGAINAPTYVKVDGGTIKTKDDKTIPTTKKGYHTYEGGFSSIWVKDTTLADKVCEIGSTQYTTLKEALDKVQSGERIKLLKDIDYPNGIVVTGKHIIFEVGQYTLNIVNNGIDLDAIGLQVHGSSGRVSLISTTGELNVTGIDCGVKAWGGGVATVTNATATKPNKGCGVFASNAGTDITVKGNVQGMANGVYAADKANVLVEKNVNASIGVVAYDLQSNVIVRGNVTATDIGVSTEKGGNILLHGTIDAVTCGARITNGGTINAKKSITATGADGVGVWLTGGGSGGGSLTVDGDIIAANYINLSGTIKLKSDGVADPTKPGYTKYTDGDDRVVWVKATTQVGTTFTALYEGVTLKYRILTEGPGNNSAMVIWSNGYQGRTTIAVPSTATYKGIDYNVTSIGTQAFINCRKATSITIPDGVTSIGNYAFESCNVLGDFTIPQSVTSIAEGAFAYCTKLTNISIPQGIKSIENLTFRACGLTSIVIPNGVESIGAGAFDACGKLTDITIPESVTSIGGNAFAFCSSLKSIHIPDKVTSVKRETFRDCKSLTEINIPAGFTDIESGAFMGCEGLTKIYIPAGITAIGSSAFAGCKVLGMIDIPVGIRSIEEYVFSGCENLSAISIPASVSSIGSGAFGRCTKLKDVTFLQQDPPNFASASFPADVTTIYVPLGCTAKYLPFTQEDAVLANAKIIEKGVYNVTVKDSYAGTTGAGSYAQGTTITINAGTRSGYSFTGWNSSEEIVFVNKKSVITTFAMPAKNVTVTAAWKYKGGSSSNGSSSGITSPTTTLDKKFNQPVRVVAPVTATIDTKGIASANILDKTVIDAIVKALTDGKKQGKVSNGIAVALNVTMPRDTDSLSVVLSQNALMNLINVEVVSFEIRNSLASVKLDLKALKAIQLQSGGNVIINIMPVTNLSTGAKDMIDSRPVYDIAVSFIKDGKNVTISAFNGGIAMISIPYTPAKDEATGCLHGVYVDDKGNATCILGSSYDTNAGAVLIPTEHLSVYGVGYTANNTRFVDISSHWAKESIDYVASRGLLSGTSETTFGPDNVMTRGMLVMAIGRLVGVDTKLYTTNSFTDVEADSIFRPYIEWAYKKGIVMGISSNQFAPDRAITREEIAAILINYAKITGYKLAVLREATTYVDSSSIGSVYKTSVTAMQQAGIMMGSSGNKFNPKSNATRGEVSTMLHRYIKLTIDPATAQGWALNDDGQYLYYMDGMAFTGWQSIDEKWYYFKTDGSLALSTKVDGYEVDDKGIRK
ncbi:MAG: leucine-rich repeat protein [Clostridiales bacterium]|nr:leucine-rich repeat protein [Clostridiales bacterium]